MLKKMILPVLLFILLTACGSSPEKAQATADAEANATQLAIPTLTPTPELPVRILIIGDSYVENHGGMDTHVVGFANLNQPSLPVEGKNIAKGGAPLSSHWQSGVAVSAIQDERWTVVVLQGDVALEGFDENGEYNKGKFFEHVRLLHEEIKNSGAETILFMHWENPTMTIEDVAAAQNEIGSELGVKVAPVGLAFVKSIEQRPELDLYAPDQNHVNLHGEYLAAAVIYATIFNDSPEGFPYYPEDQYRGGRISQEDAEFLQKIAWETVVENQGSN